MADETGVDVFPLNIRKGIKTGKAVRDNHSHNEALLSGMLFLLSDLSNLCYIILRTFCPAYAILLT
ncbi:hypothetical protein [Erysipelatoclostridium sp. DFI.2.3]|uniref:hypothetical protein n=1 Tax=Erysipelatoclostridium sp. DFI.2.3 TaxID=2849164 RepID=UPI001C381078|nr:hypothetical protein [Erysipelatoclostridium sp. DFI.2.3]